MMRSLFASVSALKNHQLRMDVIGNNIANVNTVGFKSSRVVFQEILSQTLRASTSPQEDRGGLNPRQVGLGMMLGAIETNHTQGSMETTGKMTDMAIEGDGFFILKDGSRRYYTRAGVFGVDKSGSLVSDINGMKVMGWKAINGKIDTNQELTVLEIPIGKISDPKATTTIEFGGNLEADLNGELTFPASMTVKDGDGNDCTFSIKLEEDGFNKWEWTVDSTANVAMTPSPGTITRDSDGNYTISPTDFQIDNGGSPVQLTLRQSGDGLELYNSTTGEVVATAPYIPPEIVQTVDVFDSLGNTHTVTATFEKIDVNTWKWTMTGGDSSTTGTIVFDTSGRVEQVTGNPLQFSPEGAATVSIMPDFSEVVQNANESSLVVKSQDGYPAGTLESFSVNETGTVIGEYSNGRTEELGQVALASFTNPTGLLKAGDTVFAESTNSGMAEVGQAGSGGRGKITPGALEMSNVDLSREFTNMIITQRGFQANSRVITTSDEMLQELVNLKR